MQQPRRVLISLSALALLVGLVPAGALADEASNTQTGSNSVNNASISKTTSVDFSVSNEANIDTNVNLDLNTGGNTANDNTGDGIVETGDINVDGMVHSVANTDGGSLSFPDMGDSSATASNSNTGSNSENNTSVTIEKDISISQSNTADINNDITVAANTGDNEANDNTGNGRIKTGKINVSFGIKNEANNGREDQPSPSPTPGNGGGGAGGGEVTPPPGGNGAGGGVVTPVVTPSPSPSIQAITAALVPAKVQAPQVVTPREGVGGGFFPAGSDWLQTLVILLCLSFALFYADEIAAFLARPLGREYRMQLPAV